MGHWTQEFFVDKSELFYHELHEMEEQAEQEVSSLLLLIENEFNYSPSNALDVGCGLGRHAIEFADSGHDVTGIDISPEYLAEAREWAEAAGMSEQTAFRNLDMRDLDTLDETFDLAACLFTTFGYFEDRTNVEVLRGMRRRLSSEGVCAVEVVNKDAMLNDFQSEGVTELDPGLAIERRNFDSRTSRMTVVRDVLQGDEPNFEFDGHVEYGIRLYSPPELERRFFEAGFEEVAVFGSYDGGDLSLDNNRLLVLGR